MPSSVSAQPDPAFPNGLSAELTQGDRAERLFAHHLRRLGIRKVLDVGFNAVQSALKLRHYGFEGVIYSVEAHAGAHRHLLDYSRHDPRCMPLVRQEVGATAYFRESGSVAESERVFVNEAGRLLRPDTLTGVEALKITTPGRADQVLDGYKPFLANIRLLLVELSMLEGEQNAPGLFAFDAQLTQGLGFTRISLEPAHYDDELGTVRRYHGIYCRPELPAQAHIAPVEVGAVVTSIGGALTRKRPDGEDIGPMWLRTCMDSWRKIGKPLISVSEREPPEGFQWVKTESRPTLQQILTLPSWQSGTHLLLTNADIVLTDSLVALFSQLDADAVYYGSRIDVTHDSNPQAGLKALGAFVVGFDYFLLPKSFLQMLAEEPLLSTELRIGEPWWDYALPLIAVARGFPLKKLGSNMPLALHYAHPTRYSEEIWFRNREVFSRMAGALLRDQKCCTQGLLAQLLFDPKEMPAIICNTLP